MMEAAGPVCLACAELDHLVFLGAGDAALTRRAKAKLSRTIPGIMARAVNAKRQLRARSTATAMSRKSQKRGGVING